jgi:hypothetical protein
MSQDFYTFVDGIYNRTGGYTPAVVDLRGLNASVKELNTLVGINTTGKSTVQKQLNAKANSADLGTMSAQNSNNVSITGGSLNGVSITDSNITTKVGTSSDNVTAGGTLKVDLTDSPNSAGVETNLTSYTILANSLSADLMYLEAEAFGIFAANANNKRVKLKFGTTTLLDTGSIAANAGSWSIKARIIRSGASAQKCIATIVSDNALAIDSATYTLGAEDLTTNLALFCTGEGVAGSDVIQRGLIIKWYKG